MRLKSGLRDGTDAEIMAALISICDHRRMYAPLYGVCKPHNLYMKSIHTTNRRNSCDESHRKYSDEYDSFALVNLEAGEHWYWQYDNNTIG